MGGFPGFCVRAAGHWSKEIEIARPSFQSLLMIAIRAALLFGLASIVLSGCQESESTTVTAAPQIRYPSRAQPRLATIPLYLGPEVITAELALTAIQQQTGMMFRTNMAENEGMLFIYPQPQRVGFWMLNTVLPLSAAYIDRDGVIREIHPLQPGNTNAVVSTSDQIQFILETRQGWFERKHIAPGAIVRTERGTLAQTFFPPR